MTYMSTFVAFDCHQSYDPNIDRDIKKDPSTRIQQDDSNPVIGERGDKAGARGAGRGFCRDLADVTAAVGAG